MEIPKTIINLEALLIALAQQTEPLPEYLQRSLKEIERLLREEQPQAATQLRQLVKDFPPLEKAYKKAIEELDAAYANQERTKSLSVIFPDSLDFESLFINDVIPSQEHKFLMKIVNIENFLLLIGTLVITASVALVTKKQPRRGNNKSYLEILFVSGLTLWTAFTLVKVVYKVLTDENFQKCLGSDSQIPLLLGAVLPKKRKLNHENYYRYSR